jgi:hypothetical protein
MPEGPEVKITADGIYQPKGDYAPNGNYLTQKSADNMYALKGDYLTLNVANNSSP